MAGFLLPAEAASSSPVPNELQQMLIEEPPLSQFIVKESAFGPVGSSPPLVQIPIVDVGLVFSSQDELEKLKNALSSWGCFQAMGHGISSSFLDKVREAAKHFFSLPMEEKHKCFRAVKEAEGYGSDLIVSDKQILDWSNRLFLMVFPENQRRLNLWPEIPNDFGEILIEYATKIRSLMDLCFKAMAKSLQLEEDIFLKHFGDQAVVQARYNFYPPCPRSDLVLGLKSHSDKSGVTILLQDQQVEGLQLFKDGTWFRVPIIPQALIVNLGDQMEIMSNGIFKSPLHRVTTNTERMRASVAMLIEPAAEQEIGPVDDLVDEKRPRLYQNVKNYGAFNYHCYQKGLVALDAVKM
ncbi:hypothetical protein GBA52_022401 [Prunus armeniaca]|nr:hypothetical protein GBA52_022401 [Prunus armeniaca]